MKTITILSGKGGVGKSSITASLAIALSEKKKIICADCDVDASNLALVFGTKEKDFKEWKRITTNQKAEFDMDKCNRCKKCYRACYFNAIEWENPNEEEEGEDKLGKPNLKEFSCEGCGVCEIVCPENAIKMVDVENAKIGFSESQYGFKVVSGQLEMGESGSGKVVAEVKKKASELAKDEEIMLVDSAAGIGCPVIASVVGSDYVLAVTEPTPSGFSDMKRALTMVEHFKIPYGIVINKFDINEEMTRKIEDFAKDKSAEIIGKIGYNKNFVKALVGMTPVIEIDKECESIFKEIARKLEDKISNKAEE